MSLRLLLEALEMDGWKIGMTKRSIGAEADLRPIGLFELEPRRSFGRMRIDPDRGNDTGGALECAPPAIVVPS